MKALPPGFAALGRWAQFILVRLVPSTTKPGRTEKVPFDWRTGANANAHDSAIWLSAEAAIAHLPLWGDAVVPGDLGVCLGFVLTQGAGIWCLDVDHCIKDGKWTPVAEQVMQRLHGAAIEVSQSGEGIHIWGTGSAPPHTMKCAALGSAPSMGAIFGVQVPGRAGHSKASEAQLRKGDRAWGGSVERKP